MKFLLNLSNNLSLGGRQVAQSLLMEFAEIAGDDRIGVVTSPGTAAAMELSGSDLFMCSASPANPLTRRRVLRELDAIEHEFAPDVVFSVFGPAYWRPHAPHLMGFALSQMIYRDTPLPLLMSPLRRLKFRLEFDYYKRHCILRNSDFFWCETDDVKTRMHGMLHVPLEKITMAGNTCNEFFKVVTPAPAPSDDGRFRVLTLSNNAMHKNLAIIGEIAKLLAASGVEFMVTLPDADFKSLFGRRTDIINLGQLAPRQCPDAYRRCDAVLCPSLLECFSANYPEAMASGKPIIAADLPFATQLCKDAALYYSALSAADAAEKIIELRDVPGLYAKLQEAGARRLRQFPTARQRAETLLDALHRAAAVGRAESIFTPLKSCPPKVCRWKNM